jgi:hypothetical protein
MRMERISKGIDAEIDAVGIARSYGGVCRKQKRKAINRLAYPVRIYAKLGVERLMGPLGLRFWMNITRNFIVPLKLLPHTSP